MYRKMSIKAGEKLTPQICGCSKKRQILRKRSKELTSILRRAKDQFKNILKIKKD